MYNILQNNIAKNITTLSVHRMGKFLIIIISRKLLIWLTLYSWKFPQIFHVTKVKPLKTKRNNNNYYNFSKVTRLGELVL